MKGNRALRYFERVRANIVYHETARLNNVDGTAHFDNEISRRGKDRAVTQTHLFHDTRFCRGSSRCGCRAGLRAVFPAGVQIKGAEIIKSAPDDHFTASPDRRVIRSASGALVGVVAVQLSRARIVSAAGVVNRFSTLLPPQTIMSLPVHTAV